MTGAQIKKVVESVIMFHGVNRTHPDLADLSKRTGVHIVKNEKFHKLRPGEYARMFFDGETWIFVYDETLTLEQKRFAIAHEFGHKFLNHTYRHFLDRDVKHNGAPLHEWEADMFAKYLLGYPPNAKHPCRRKKPRTDAAVQSTSIQSEPTENATNGCDNIIS